MPKATSKKSRQKRGGKKRTQNRGLLELLRHWSLPLFLIFLLCFSLAATFYVIFLHPPSKPLF